MAGNYSASVTLTDNALDSPQTVPIDATAFVPENFGTETVFTIGTPDRSSHEFLHGHDAQGHDLRDYWDSWNY